MKRIVITLAMIVVACDDPAAPCTDCIDGYEVGIAAVRVNPTMGRDAAGIPIVAPGAVPIEVVLRNVGEEASPPAKLDLDLSDGSQRPDLDIPSIAARDSLVITTSIEDTITHIFAYDPSVNDRLHARATLTIDGDADDTNHFMMSGDYHYAVPVLSGRVHALANPKPRVNEPFRVTLTFENRSAYAASAPLTLRFCLVDFDIGCTPGNWATFGRIDIPAIAPSSVNTSSVMTAITPQATMPDETYSFGLSACTTPPGWLDPYLDIFSTQCFGAPGTIIVLPDYEGSCVVPNATAGIPINFTSHNCGILPPTVQLPPRSSDFRRFHIVSLDAVAGRTYQVTRSVTSPTLQVFNSDGDTMRNVLSGQNLTFPDSGRYYLVMYTNSPQLTVQVAPL